MMNSDEINAALLSIKETSGKNDKIAMLTTWLQDDGFKNAIVMMLDPRRRFGIAEKTLKAVEKEVDEFSPFPTAWGGFQDFSVYLMLESMEKGKITGNTAFDYLKRLRFGLTNASWQLLRKVLLKKPDAGFTASSVNKAMPGLIWDFSCMLAKPYEEKRVEWPAIVEPKIDGVRCLIMAEIDVEKGEHKIGFFSRSGKAFEAFEHLAGALAELYAKNPIFGNAASFIVDSEVDSGQFNETVSQARSKGGEAQDAIVRIFDLLTAEEFAAGGGDVVYIERRKRISALFGGMNGDGYHPAYQPLKCYLAKSHDEAMELNQKFWDDGLEGSIIKPPRHLYRCKRSFDWLKIKTLETHDMVIEGFFEGTRKYEGQLGGVICMLDGVEVRVGGGWTDEDREHIWANQDKFLGRMIEVAAHEKTPDGSLRHPRFKRWRDDKAAA